MNECNIQSRYHTSYLFGPMGIFGPSVFYLFGPLVINSVLQFSIYSALQIWPYGPVRPRLHINSFQNLTYTN